MNKNIKEAFADFCSLTGAHKRPMTLNDTLKGESAVKMKLKAFWAKVCGFAKKAWSAKFDTVKPVVAWCTIGGVFALAVVLALVVWL